MDILIDPYRFKARLVLTSELYPLVVEEQSDLLGFGLTPLTWSLALMCCHSWSRGSVCFVRIINSPSTVKLAVLGRGW